MEYKKYLDKYLINQVKEKIEEYEENSFALVIVNDKHADFDSVFDDLEMNHYFFTTHWGEEGEYSIRFLSGSNLDCTSENLKKILKDVYIDSCEIPISIIL